VQNAVSTCRQDTQKNDFGLVHREESFSCPLSIVEPALVPLVPNLPIGNALVCESPIRGALSANQAFRGHIDYLFRKPWFSKQSFGDNCVPNQEIGNEGQNALVSEILLR
jgi:hypothetical protein